MDFIIYARQNKEKKFWSYSTKDAAGKTLNVRFTANAKGTKPTEHSVVEVDTTTAFITPPNDAGYETLVINGAFKVLGKYAPKHKEFDKSRFAAISAEDYVAEPITDELPF